MLINAHRVRRIIDRLPEGILLVDAEGRIQFANHTARRLTGFDLRDNPDLHVRDVVVEEDLPACREALTRALAGEDIPYLVLGMYRLDGRPVKRVVAGTRLEDGLALVVIRDVPPPTDQLSLSEERYRALFEGANDGVFLESLDGGILDVNERGCEMLGYQRAELVGHNVRELIPPQTAEQLDEMMEHIRHEGGLTIEAVNFHRDGHAIPVEVSARILDIGGEPTLLTLVRDITARKRAEEERRRMEEHLLHIQKLESLGDLSGGLAHDFNNLLVGILGFAELALLKLSKGHPARRMMQEIERAARSANDLTVQLLAYSGSAHHEKEPFDLNQLVEDSIVVVRTSVSRKVNIEQHFDRSIPPLRGNPTQIQQVVMNLCLNASEAIGDASGTITLRTGVEQVEGRDCPAALATSPLEPGTYVTLEVSDDGCGMEPGFDQRIFDPFYTTKRPGRGLGLAAAYGIMRDHAGAMVVVSEPDRGTIFRVLLPVDESEEEERQSDGEDLPEGHETVLLVDDEPVVRAYAGEALGMLGYTVVLASDGAEALATFHELRPDIDLVIADAMMPGLNGVELFHELRHIDPEVRVLLSSGYDEAETTRPVTDQGLAGFLQKPYTLRALAEKVRVALDGSPSGDPSL